MRVVRGSLVNTDVVRLLRTFEFWAAYSEFDPIKDPIDATVTIVRRGGLSLLVAAVLDAHGTRIDVRIEDGSTGESDSLAYVDGAHDMVDLFTMDELLAIARSVEGDGGRDAANLTQLLLHPFAVAVPAALR